MRNSDQEPSPPDSSSIAKPQQEDLRNHPVYLYNQIALKFGSLSAVLAGLAVVILYPAPHNITIGVTVSPISVLFSAESFDPQSKHAVTTGSDRFRIPAAGFPYSVVLHFARSE